MKISLDETECIDENGLFTNLGEEMCREKVSDPKENIGGE